MKNYLSRDGWQQNIAQKISLPKPTHRWIGWPLTGALSLTVQLWR
jgi:hypothetical protein